jgi:tRNA A37 threonylcarbamoyladenosine dehydratase
MNQAARKETPFSRTELLLGAEGVRRLAQARVAVCGLGAVGSYAAEALARAGVGHLRLVDFDVVRESNINRQLYALHSTLGRKKVEVARARILDINPGCDVEALPAFADFRTAESILAGGIDVVIDAIDSLGPKIELIAAVVRSGTRLISSMGAATRRDPLAIRVGDISETRGCPLARFVRKWLKKKGIIRGITCVYSMEPCGESYRRAVGLPEEGGVDGEQSGESRGRKRRPLGSVSYVTGVFGLVAAREAVEFILAAPLSESRRDDRITLNLSRGIRPTGNGSPVSGA